MKLYAKRISAATFGIAALILAGCDSGPADLGEFNSDGKYTKVQLAAVSNCLDLAKRSASGFGYSPPTGKPDSVARSGENDYEITWKFDTKPKQYQCIVGKSGEARKYFWG